MSRDALMLLSISATVGFTLLLAWGAVQVLVLRPAVAERESYRIQETLRAAELLRSGMSTRQVEESRGIDIRALHGHAEGPPPGLGWKRHVSARGAIWKRQRNYEIAVWSGQLWVVLQSHPPYAATLAVCLIAIGLPVVVLVFGLTQRASRYQRRAEECMERLAAGDLNVRLDTQRGNRETRRVAASLNRLAARLQALVEADRKTMAGLSHELRTPLTRIRLELELARREGTARERLDRVELDIEAFDAMLQELLELSELQLVGENTLRRETVDLAGLAQLVTEEEGWDDVEIHGSGTAYADAVLLARLLRNLLRNSAQHARGRARWVGVADDELTVGDDGSGIPLERQPRVLEAFQRGDSSAGHGLGLTIVTQIVALHGGTVELSAPPGLEVRILLAAPADSSGVG